MWSTDFLIKSYIAETLISSVKIPESITFNDKVSKVSIVSYIEILFVIAIGSIYFNENFETLVYIGMFLVTFGVVFNVTYFKSDKQNI